MEKQTNFLIPKQRRLQKNEVDELLKKYSLTSVFKLPKIRAKDPSLVGLELEPGDVIEIERTSFVGKTFYYRVVLE